MKCLRMLMEQLAVGLIIVLLTPRFARSPDLQMDVNGRIVNGNGAICQIKDLNGDYDLVTPLSLGIRERSNFSIVD